MDNDVKRFIISGLRSLQKGAQKAIDKLESDDGETPVAILKKFCENARHAFFDERPVRVSEGFDYISYEIDLEGFTAEDVHVHVEDNELCISAVHGMNFCMRKVQLPSNLEICGSPKVEYEDDVLTVTFPIRKRKFGHCYRSCPC